jgi:hypothetical protein
MKLVALAVVVGGTVGIANAQPAAPAPAPSSSSEPQDPYAAPAPVAPAPAPYPPPAQPYPAQPYPAAYPYAQPYGYQAPVIVASGPPPRRTGHLELTADFAAIGVLGTVAAMDARDFDDKNTGTLLVMGGAIGGGAIGYLLADGLDVTRGEAHATTMGLGLGAANGALLLVPLGADDASDEVLTTLFVSGAIGATGGLLVGKKLHMTEGQALFAGNVALLGIGTAAIGGALMHDDGEDLEGSSMGTLAIGLDAGALAGLVIAPRIDWSRRRARYVGLASLAGCFAGSLIGALASGNKNEDGSSDPDPDVAAAGLLVGMWGGFAAGIALTGDFAPDPGHSPPSGPRTSLMPMVGAGREVGVAVAGGF